MPDSKSRAEKGNAPAPLNPTPPAPDPTTDASSVWDDNALAIPSPTSLNNAFNLSPEGGAHKPPTDNSPTVISRPPTLNGSGEQGAIGSLRGRRLAHFELIAPIGVGGMAAVIKGRDLQLDRIVALKILPPDMATDPENIRRFHQEARAAAKLDHENIARVFFYGEDQKLHFIAFEFVQGDNLRTILERRGKLPVGEAVHYLLQVTTGLAHASSRGVVHRDIKPSNIIITPNGRAKLVDMGLARTQIPQDERALTQSGVTLGTFDYISPEQAMEPRDADVRSDIYSLGCTFYHMLTGQPPVPEGTAAKKLHFHQHELPVDPRQLNPAVPDEVAAVVARMMAKNPRDRFQKPEHLVEQLLRVAQKLDSTSDNPSGLLYVDAPMPTKPTKPFYFIAMAVAAVVALVFALDQPEPRKPSMPSRPLVRHGGGDSKSRSDDPPLKITDKQERPPDISPQPVAGPQPIKIDFMKDMTVDQLRAQIAKHASPNADLEIVLADDLKLDLKDSVGLSVTARRIILRSDDVKERREIWLQYNGEADKAMKALALTADHVTLRGLRVAVTGAASVAMTGVHLIGGQKHEIDDCHFVQQYPSYLDEKPMTSVLLEGSPRYGNRPELVVRDCLFLGEEVSGGVGGERPTRLELRRIGRGGQYALARTGPGILSVSQTVFGPHLGCVRLMGDSRSGADPDVKLHHCSTLLADGSSVLSLDDKAAAHADVQYSLFSRPAVRTTETPASMTTATALIRQQSLEGPRFTTLRYRGDGNRYHNLDAYWLDPRLDTPSTAGWKDFLARLEVGSGNEIRSGTLDVFPWEETLPLALLPSMEFHRAFRVRQQLAELRVPGQTLEHLIGAERCDGTSYIRGSLAPPDGAKPPEAARKEKIVDPTIARSENNTFKSLIQALEETQPGDVVSIRHNGKLPLNPITLERDKLDVTIKPAPGFHPVLTLSTAVKEAALFQLHEGKIKFVDLDFLLEPTRKDFDSQAVVAIAGEGTCLFEGCTITLSEPQGCQLFAVMLGDPGAEVGRPIKPGEFVSSGPRVGFDRCLIRGRGDLLWCRASRPFRLEATQTLAALSGSLLLVDGSKFAETMPAPGVTDIGPRCIIDLKHVTAVIYGPLFYLRTTGDLKSLVPLHCKPSDCLFVPLGSKPLMLLSDLNTKATDTALKERLPWGGEGGKNTYGPFQGMIEQQLNSVEMMRPKPYDREKWKDFTAETESRFLDAVKFADTIDSASLPRSRPSQFVLPAMRDLGANTDNLPDPVRDEK